MPFLGKDWRSCGEQWIRTEHGWERTRVLECILDNINFGLSNQHASRKMKNSRQSINKRLNSQNDEDVFDKEEDLEMEEEDKQDLNYIYDELSLLSDDEDEGEDDSENSRQDDDQSVVSYKSSTKLLKEHYSSLRRLCISSESSVRMRQPHIIFFDFEASNRENNAPKATISEVLNALDMPSAVKDIKRFNYVCRLVQIIINEKLTQLSGNAQRTLFMIVKHMLIQVIKTQENLNVMRKLLYDFKKKIQDSIFFYFHYIGSQKLCDRHLTTINKWIEILENPNHKKVKRLLKINASTARRANENDENADNSGNEKENHHKKASNFDCIPTDCKLEIMRRLTNGLDLINLSKCNKGLNDLISNELKIWKNLCQFHFQQTNINSFVTRLSTNNNNNKFDKTKESIDTNLDWKQIYFKLRRRYGHREVYADMIHKCCNCKSLFWKEIGHPCIFKQSTNNQEEIEFRTEPITPKKLIDLLLK